MVRDFSSRFWTDILLLLIGIAAIVVVNQLVSRSFFRIDLTEEKRFTISEPTRNILQELDDNIYIDVYLAGDLPAGFKRMQRSITETLEEFSVYSDDLVQFNFIDPYSNIDQQSAGQQIQTLIEKGLIPTDVFTSEEGGQQQKRILPGVVISYAGIEKGVNLFKGNVTAEPEIRLNQSIEGIEYELINGIKELTTVERPTVGIIGGHDELTGNQNIALRSGLSEKYLLKEASLLAPVEGISLLLLARPRQPFSEVERYHLDQFIMNGGKVLWMVQGVNVELDSIRQGTVAFANDPGLTDMLFRYGVRINNDLVQDIISGTIPIVVGQAGEAPQVRPLPWPYYPIINNFSGHPITRNLDAVLVRFASTIDTVKAEGIVKTPLMFSSGYSRHLNSPISISLESLRNNTDRESFTESNLPLGYLLEGEFISAFRNRLLPEGVDKSGFKEKGVQSGMVIFSDGDLGRNEIDPRNQQPMPLGTDPYSEFVFANLDLIMNSVSYLLEGDGVITARSKQIAIRPLDKVKVEERRGFWQIINMVVPILILVLFGFVRAKLRERRYAK